MVLLCTLVLFGVAAFSYSRTYFQVGVWCIIVIIEYPGAGGQRRGGAVRGTHHVVRAARQRPVGGQRSYGQRATKQLAIAAAGVALGVAPAQ